MLKSSSNWRRTPSLALDTVAMDTSISNTAEEPDEPTSKPVTCCTSGNDMSSVIGLSEICSSGSEGGAASSGVELQPPQTSQQQQQLLQEVAQSQLSLRVSVPNHRTMIKTKSALSLSSMCGNDPAALISPAKPKDKRTMRFSSTVRVCLVPTRDELKVVMDELFFRPEDYTRFKSEAVTELRDVLVKLGVTSKQAIEILYQPQPRGTDYYRAPSRSKAHRRHHQHHRGSSTRRGKVTQEGSDGSGSTDEDASSAEDEDEDEDEARMAAARARASASASASEGPSLSDDEGEEMESEVESKSDKRGGGGDKDVGKSSEAASAAKARETQSMHNAAAALVRRMPSPVPEEGPTLSDDEEERAMVIESQTKSLKFITGIKTDIELNQDMQSKMQQQGAGGKDGRSLPVRTPSGRDAQSDNGTVWYSKWQKSAAQVVDVVAEHKSAMAGSPCTTSPSFLRGGVSPSGSSASVKGATSALPVKEVTLGAAIVKAKLAAFQMSLPSSASSSPAKGVSSPDISPVPSFSSSAPQVQPAKAMSPWQRKAAGLA